MPLEHLAVRDQVLVTIFFMSIRTFVLVQTGRDLEEIAFDTSTLCVLIAENAALACFAVVALPTKRIASGARNDAFCGGLRGL